jgi:predicted metalloprotease with PDZ domain
MRTLVLSLVIGAGACACAAMPADRGAALEPDIRYTIELLDPAEPRILVSVEAAGDADGESELRVSQDWSGPIEAGQDLELTSAVQPDGTCAFERIETGIWRVEHEPGARLTCRFEIGRTDHRAAASSPEYYLPIVEPELVQLIGQHALPAPDHLSGDVPRRIALAWRGFAERGWSVASSFGVGPEERLLERPLDEFRHAVFLAGALAIHERKIHGSPLAVAIAGGGFRFTDQGFVDLVERIVELERGFFGEFERAFYLVSVIPVGAEEEGVSSFGGTGLTDSFALYLRPGTDLKNGSGEGSDIAWLLAHELFHDWNGHAIRLAQPEALGYWFSEGFTNFYARRLLFRGGLLGLEGYAALWNRCLAAYATNPERNAPSDRVREAFWTNPDVGSLPYERGDIAALIVDHGIRARSGGELCLDDLMRALVARARAGEASFDNEALLGAIAEFAGAATAGRVRAIVLDGAPADPDPDALVPDLALVPVEIARFELGFDHERAAQERVLAGVVPGSAAERAGLVDGMALRGWSVHFGAADRPVELVVEDEGVERTFRYLPAGAPLPGWRAEIPGAADAEQRP